MGEKISLVQYERAMELQTGREEQNGGGISFEGDGSTSWEIEVTFSFFDSIGASQLALISPKQLNKIREVGGMVGRGA